MGLVELLNVVACGGFCASTIDQEVLMTMLQ